MPHRAPSPIDLLQLPLLALLFHLLDRFEVNVPYDYASMPSWPSMLCRLFFCLCVEDALHYVVHRTLHHRFFYGWLHSEHHQFTAPYSIISEVAHPLEALILGTGFFLPLMVVGSHLAVLWAWLAVRTMQTNDAHSGYDFPYLNPLYLIPGYGKR
jgi:methylsterol monooxygenase